MTTTATSIIGDDASLSTELLAIKLVLSLAWSLKLKKVV
jgi:hypothetical protein